jgi:hypothetical protein
MKKLFVALLCVIMVCAMPLVAFAESADSAETTGTIENTEEWIEAKMTTDAIIGYVQSHLEEVSVIITLILTVFYQIRKHASLNKSIGTLNNNAVAVAENSSNAIGEALVGVKSVSDVVEGYKVEMEKLLLEVRSNEEEKRKLAETLATVEKYLETSKAANIELSNEVAELLVLANIPNSKKEELYSRHRAAVDAIAATEKTEVIVDEQKA